VICAQGMLSELQNRLLFFYTGITRSASDQLRQQAALFRGDVRAERTGRLVRIAEMAFDEICAGRLQALGPMLHEAWQVKRGRATGSTTVAIDDASGAAMRDGAEGGKMLGAGGGGFLMFLAPPERHAAVRRALEPLRETPFRLVHHGSNIIFVH